MNEEGNVNKLNKNDIPKEKYSEVDKYIEDLLYEEAKKLEGYAERNWNSIRKFSRMVKIIFTILTVSLLCLGILSVSLSSTTSNLSIENSDRIKEIKNSRINSIKISCEESNERNKKAKLGIESIVIKNFNKKLTLNEYKKQEYLINEFVQALVPSYNCIERIKKLIKP